MSEILTADDLLHQIYCYAAKGRSQKIGNVLTDLVEKRQLQQAAVIFNISKAERKYNLIKPRITDLELTRDQILSIILYTQQWDNVDGSVYSIINKILRERKQEYIEIWGDYLGLLFSALRVLPREKEGIVFRVVQREFELKEIGYIPQTNTFGCFPWFGFTSTTRSLVKIKGFIDPEKPSILFVIDLKYGVDLRMFSEVSTEEEIVLLPCSIFKVESSFDILGAAIKANRQNRSIARLDRIIHLVQNENASHYEQ
eukprot:TRINITY_DN15317_c0_g1_i1.p1 TRINITY_DN15317_c0_g1~~TRINITY_DN15317_c0_g1_i1.p1  ORF type:complete len:256 (+),score=34.56 TRINITY_DN15317_c0_g1_i1:35-802(+)